MAPKTPPRAELSRREKQNTLRSQARVYFGSGAFSGQPVSLLSWEGDKTTHQTKMKMRRDPMIALGMWVTKAPVCTADFQVLCPDAVIKAFVREQLERHWIKLLRTTLNMLDFGWQPHEKVYAVKDVQITVKESPAAGASTLPEPQVVTLPGMITLDRLKDIPVNTILPVYDADTDDFIGVSQNQPGTVGRVVIPKDKLYVPVFQEEWGNMEGKSLLDNSYRPWYYSFIVESLWARFMERRAIPPVIGTGPTGTRTDAQGNEYSVEDLVLTIVNNIHSGNGGYLPFEPDAITGENAWKLETLQFFNQSDQFQTFMASMDARMLRGILMPEKALIQGAKVGTLSETEQFTDTFLTGLDVLLFEIERFINEQIVEPLVRLNFASPPPCTIKVSQITSQRRAAVKDLVALMMDATSVNSRGVQFRFKDQIDFESMARQMGVPLREANDILQLKNDTPSTDPQAPSNQPKDERGANDATKGAKGKARNPSPKNKR